MDKAERDRRYEEAVRQDKASPLPRREWEAMRLRAVETFVNESRFGGLTPSKGTTRAEFLKQLLETTQAASRGCGAVEWVKPRGFEDLCWHEVRQPHPIGELANTYEAREEMRVIILGPRPPSYVASDGMTIVPEEPKLYLQIVYVKDLNC